jgi:hypothetical protein
MRIMGKPTLGAIARRYDPVALHNTDGRYSKVKGYTHLQNNIMAQQNDFRNP